jgi:ubiquinone/menaquinone biosynthesis C-methylase UbiE
LPYLKLKTEGRKTGLPHVVELRYVLLEGSLFVLSGASSSDWVRNALSKKAGTVRIGELSFEVSAEPTTDEELTTAYGEFRRRFGARFVDEWYGHSGACLRLTPTGSPTRRGATAGETEVKTSLEEWRREGRSYYGEVAAAFDSASDEYDFTISHNFINTWIRRRSIEVLRHYLSPSDILLEIGSGTGAEAFEIIRWVRGIVAIDISQQMVDLLIRKAKAKHLEDKVRAARIPASEVGRASGLLGADGFGAAYSFNGALNCEPRVEDFARQLHGLLKRGGYFVCSVRNNLCLSEVLSHAAAFQFSRTNPRRKQPIMVSVGGRDIPSYYYSPGRFREFFRPYFHLKEMIALPALLPPAYLNDYYLRIRNLTSGIEKLDAAVSGLFPLNRLGDQTLFVFQKADATSGGERT